MPECLDHKIECTVSRDTYQLFQARDCPWVGVRQVAEPFGQDLAGIAPLHIRGLAVMVMDLPRDRIVGHVGAFLNRLAATISIARVICLILVMLRKRCLISRVLSIS